jgi:very-short-patch-repair endonuclease
MTDAERLLWSKLKANQLGVKFRRQQPIENYIVDFVCFNKKLIIELDGGQHFESKKDRLRDKWFQRNGFRILRFWNNEVLGNIEGVLEVIREKITLPLIPSRQGRGDNGMDSHQRRGNSGSMARRERGNSKGFRENI